MKTRIFSLCALLSLSALSAAVPYTQAWSRMLPNGTTVDVVASKDGNGAFWLTYDGMSDYELNGFDRYGNMKFSKSLLWNEITDMDVLADGTLVLVGSKQVQVGASSRSRMTIGEYSSVNGNLIRETSDTVVGAFNSRGLTVTKSTRPALGGVLKQVILAGGVNSTNNLSRFFLRTVNAGVNVEGFGSLGGFAQSQVMSVVSDKSGAHWALEQGGAFPNRLTRLYRLGYNPGAMTMDSALIETSPVGKLGVDLVEVPSPGVNPYLVYAGDDAVGSFFRQVFVNRTTNAVTAIQNATSAGYGFLDLKMFNNGYALGLKRNADSMLRTVGYNNAGGNVGSRFQGRSILNDYFDLLPTGSTLNTAGTFQDGVGTDRLVASSLDPTLTILDTFAMNMPKMYRPSSDALNTNEIYTGADDGMNRRFVKLTRFKLIDFEMPPTVQGGNAFTYKLFLNNKTLGVMGVNITSSHPAIIPNVQTTWPVNQFTITRTLGTIAPAMNTAVTVTYTVAGTSVTGTIQVTN